MAASVLKDCTKKGEQYFSPFVRGHVYLLVISAAQISAQSTSAEYTLNNPIANIHVTVLNIDFNHMSHDRQSSHRRRQVSDYA